MPEVDPSDCYKLLCRCKRATVVSRRRDGKRKLNMKNFELMERILCQDETQGRTYLDVMQDKSSSLQEQGWKIRKDAYKVDHDLLIYKCTLYCKWRDVCDCNAIIKIEFVPPLKEFHILWYTSATAHGILEASNSFSSYSDHESFQHKRLPNNILGKSMLTRDEINLVSH